MKLKRTAVLVLATLSIVLVSSNPGIVEARPHKNNIVTFGDSYFANPTVAQYHAAKIAAEAANRGYTLETYPQGVKRRPSKTHPVYECAHDPRGIPALINQKTGVKVRDYSCSGAVLYTKNVNNLDRQIRYAIADKALNRYTSFVPIQIGFNDTYHNVSTKNKAALFARAIDAAIAKIRSHAPRARIALVNYPTISEPGTSRQCLLHTTVLGQPVDGVGIPAFWIEDGEKETSIFMKKSAKRNKTMFIDVRPVTADRHECTSDDKRIIAGVIDTRTKGYNLPVHLNTVGKEIIASKIAARY